jgi:putative permease
MRKIFNKWIDRYFSDEEALFLFLLLAVGLAVVVFLGAPLAPVFASLIIAFLMQGLVNWLQARGLSHLPSVILVFLVFVGFVAGFLLFVMPIAWRQLVNLFNELPGMVSQVQSLLLLLPEKYPHLVSEAQIRELIGIAATELSRLGQWVVTFSLNSLTGIAALLIYLVLVPILVFFFLKDGESMMASFSALLPRIWLEMDLQIANYVRGKAIEILIVGAVTWVVFTVLGINYAALLALMVGLSVLIPYIGAAVVTVPIALIGFFQWGWGSEFMWIMIAYAIIQALDGNVLVPLLFSEAVNLHPVSIIVSVLIFGSLWGFWGLFFAIPLATLVKAVMTAWPIAIASQGEEPPEAS